jgi:hypothetical protein
VAQPARPPRRRVERGGRGRRGGPRLRLRPWPSLSACVAGWVRPGCGCPHTVTHITAQPVPGRAPRGKSQITRRKLGGSHTSGRDRDSSIVRPVAVDPDPGDTAHSTQQQQARSSCCGRRRRAAACCMLVQACGHWARAAALRQPQPPPVGHRIRNTGAVLAPVPISLAYAHVSGLAIRWAPRHRRGAAGRVARVESGQRWHGQKPHGRHTSSRQHPLAEPF